MAWYDWYKVVIPHSVMQTNANQLDVQPNPPKVSCFFWSGKRLNINGIDTENVADVRATFAGSVEHRGSENALNLASAGLSATSGSGSGGVLKCSLGSATAAGGPVRPCAQEHYVLFSPSREDE